MAYEDFTTFTETDSGNDITVTATKCAVDLMRRDAVSHVVKDYGAGYFGNFLHHIDALITTGDVQLRVGVWAILNLAGRTIDQMDADNQGTMVTFYRWSTGEFGLIFKDHTDNDQDALQIGKTPPYQRYLIIERAGTVGTCKIYTDSSRSTLEDTLSIPAITSTTYRYLEVSFSEGDPGQTARGTGDIENLDLDPSAEAVTYGRLRGVVHWS